MNGKIFLNAMMFCWITAAFLLGPAISMGQEAPKMSKETLKGMLGEPDLIILDVRRGRDWKVGEFKIQSAVRADPKEFAIWQNRFLKDNKLVLYCA